MDGVTSGWAAAAVFAVALLFSGAAGAQTNPTLYLHLDGNYYAGSLPPPSINYILSINFLTALNFPGMRDCQRPDGSPPLDGVHTLAFGTFAAPTGVGANSFRVFPGVPMIFDVTSVTGDVSCVGSLAPESVPESIVQRVTGSHPTRIFSSGFETAGALPKSAVHIHNAGFE